MTSSFLPAVQCCSFAVMCRISDVSLRYKKQDMFVILKRLLFLVAAVRPVLTTCSHALFQLSGSPFPANCPDYSTGSVYRTGYSDPRWTTYAATYPLTQTPTSAYSLHPQSQLGFGYSYAYDDPRRPDESYNQPYVTAYGSYPRGSYTNSPYSYPAYPVNYQTRPHSHAYPSSHQYYPSIIHGSQSAQNGWYTSPTTVSTLPMNYQQAYSVDGQYAHSTGSLGQPHLNPNFAQQQQQQIYLVRSGRQSLAREGYAVMKGHPSTAVSGTIEFCQVAPASVRVKGRLTGLPGPAGNRGLHVLKDSACPPLDQFPIDPQALEHFNPFNSATHGSRDSVQKHAGHLDNIFVQFDGVSTIDFTVKQVFLDGESVYSIANHSIVITEREDDLGLNQNIESRLRGNSGRAIACGVIRIKASSSLFHSFVPSSPFFPEEPFSRRSRRQDHYAPFPPQNYPFLLQ